MTNPFLNQQPAPAPAQQPQAAPANPFGPGVPAAPAQQPQAAPGNPYGQPQQQAQYQAPAPATAPQQQYQAPAPQQQAAAPALNMGDLRSAGAPIVGNGRGAALPDMYGRLVLVFPLSLTRVPKKAEHITPEQRAAGNVDQDQLTATVVVLDDGNGGMAPIWYGGKPHLLGGAPHTDSAPLPYVRKAMWLNQSRLVSQLRDFLPTGGPGTGGMICGRVVKAGPENNAPWYLQGANEQELALAGKYLELVQSGTYEHPLA